jgi:N-acetylgalactosamine-N,N'-diacetylbacillosaminyl-diphospho-undecaprenol 4-alpha-N-acetylgalactosaminyltransferase
MYRFFRNNSFDYIIDARVKHHYLQEWIITKLIYNAPLIVWVHSYMTHLYFPITKLVARIIYSKSKIVAVSDKIKAKIYTNYGFDDVTTMYNPIDFSAIENSLDTDEKLDFEYIIAAGSLKNNIKQFDVLLSCYHQSILPSKGIKLVFMGDGVSLKHLKQLACDLHLQDNVVFLGRKQNPFPFYKEAKCTVLTSKNEGFPMVLIESLATGTPVISYDCDSGPSEIIQNGVNGWLVADQNPQKMTDALNEMVENEKLYLHCKANSKQSVASFSLESIGENWLTLLK